MLTFVVVHHNSSNATNEYLPCYHESILSHPRNLAENTIVTFCGHAIHHCARAEPSVKDKDNNNTATKLILECITTAAADFGARVTSSTL